MAADWACSLARFLLIHLISQCHGKQGNYSRGTHMHGILGKQGTGQEAEFA